MATLSTDDRATLVRKSISPAVLAAELDGLAEGEKPAHIAKRLKVARSTVYEALKGDPKVS